MMNMTHACQLTEISKHDFPELIQFYRHFSQKYPFLLTTSSKKFHHQLSSDFDILFIEPEEWLNLDHELKLTTSSHLNIKSNNFLDAFDQLYLTAHNRVSPLIEKQHSSLLSSLPFTGGWFVFFAYELAQQIEPCLKLTFNNQLLPVAYAARVKKALILDHKKDRLFLLTESDMNHDKCYQNLLRDAQYIINSKQKKSALKKLPCSLQEENDHLFISSVKKVKQYIKEGDVFQVNLSRLWQSGINSKNHIAQAYSLSKALSEENPAPFSGIASIKSEQGIATIISSSPERLLKVKDNFLESRPIAGTHPRSASKKEDSRLQDELHAHPKEQAEHIMLIDLIRNDLGRVCIPGSVKVDEFMSNESYAHVHHIVSNVSGELQSEKTPGDVIKALFPGGTITGCPKVRCMEIIAELEQQSRGAYTGSMGYINLDGSMDLNILIRTMVLEMVLETALETEMDSETEIADKYCSQKLSFRAGAGLVFDSIAEQELAETRTKAKGLLRALNVRALKASS